MDTDLDFSRRPTAKEHLKLEGRLRRLGRPDHLLRLKSVSARIPGAIPTAGLRLRDGFSFREGGLLADASDRKAPPRNLRPPATRLITARGAALRFELTLIAVVQSMRKAGAKARLSDLGIASVGSADTLGWTDLVAAEAVDSKGRDGFITAKDKRARTVRSALATLEAAGLIVMPDDPGARRRYENFVLLNERGMEAVGEAEEYRVPGRAEKTFVLPSGFITNGWIHVLEDSEIALLLMVACGKGAWPDGGLLAMEAETRLRNYGIHRDSFSAARKTLDWFGLLEVDELRRHGDGRAEEGDLRVHRLGLVSAGFDESGPDRVLHVLQEQVGRR